MSGFNFYNKGYVVCTPLPLNSLAHGAHYFVCVCALGAKQTYKLSYIMLIIKTHYIQKFACVFIP